MQQTFQSEFVGKDGTINMDKAIEAGHDARTTAILDFTAWLSSSLKTVIYRGAWERM